MFLYIFIESLIQQNHRKMSLAIWGNATGPISSVVQGINIEESRGHYSPPIITIQNKIVEPVFINDKPVIFTIGYLTTSINRFTDKEMTVLKNFTFILTDIQINETDKIRIWVLDNGDRLYLDNIHNIKFTKIMNDCMNSIGIDGGLGVIYGYYPPDSILAICPEAIQIQRIVNSKLYEFLRRKENFSWTIKYSNLDEDPEINTYCY